MTKTTQRGMALLAVLHLVLMIAALAGATAQTSMLALRGAQAEVEHVRAFHAADAVMVLCERHLLERLAAGHHIVGGVMPVLKDVSRWPGSVNLPQCAIETLSEPRARSRRRSYRITAQGFASTEDAQSWAQMELVFTSGVSYQRYWS